MLRKLKNLSINLRIKYASSASYRADLIREHYDVIMGEDCEIYDEVSFGSEPYLIEIGNQVRVTNGVRFITHDGGVWVLRNLGLEKNADIFGKIKIGDNVHIGSDVVIMPDITIGNNVVIGVGAVVTKDIPSNTVAAGVPAKQIRTLEEYHEKNFKKIDYTKNLSQNEKKNYLLKKYSQN